MESKKVVPGLIQDAIDSMSEYSESEGVDENRNENTPREKTEQVSEKYIKWFSELNNDDIDIAGIKGASLSEMYNAKFPIPPGFVITTKGYEYFITENNLKEKIDEILKKVNIEDTDDLLRKSQEIRNLIENAKIPEDLKNEIIESYHILGNENVREQGVSEDALNILKHAQEPTFVSVRSSASVKSRGSFAGQQESFLNIKGDKKLTEIVKRCFSSLYSARAIFYKIKNDLDEIPIAVIIQKMIDAEKAGIAFSADPVNKEGVIIEAVYGLGEGISSGKIHPDRYTSQNLEIESVKIADKRVAVVRNSSGDSEIVRLNPERSRSQVLTNGQILEVSDLVKKIENFYKESCSMEFSIESGKIYIIQTRAIKPSKKHGQKIEGGDVIIKGSGASPGAGTGIVRIIKSKEDLSKIKKGDIVVSGITSPDIILTTEKASAIITDEGGITSHAAVVCRELGIPLIVGTKEATSMLKDGMTVSVDGSTGKIYQGEISETKNIEIKEALKTQRVKLKIAVDLPEFAKTASRCRVDDAGLVRIEPIIASSKKHPLCYKKENKIEDYRELLKENLNKIAENFDSLCIRTSDIRTDEYNLLEGSPEREFNPLLGIHGIRFSLQHPEILEAELSAIKDVAERNPEKKIGVVFPQIISVDEVKKAKEFFNKFRTENMEFGILVETPSAVLIIEDICNESDFIFLGIRDLTQYTLAVDQGNKELQDIYHENHPAIFSQIKRVIGACRRTKTQSNVCAFTIKKDIIDFLFRKGINSLTVSPDEAYEVSVILKNMEDEREQPVKHEEHLEKKPVENYEKPRESSESKKLSEDSFEKPGLPQPPSPDRKVYESNEKEKQDIDKNERENQYNEKKEYVKKEKQDYESNKEEEKAHEKVDNMIRELDEELQKEDYEENLGVYKPDSYEEEKTYKYFNDD
ncbi:phosphoenolpyruvate synthase [Candidatus Pacearchaeota archaeon]|nr:phosphoenolpyruvate synthase [Candidatus Pacearchaeota archaeon]MBD3283493.1 phosphoenolpyruvate synthase [Candidatus Pacearchaeota archaeon]